VSRRVAILAAECVTALGADLASTEEALLAGRRGVAAIEGFDATAFGSDAAARLGPLAPTTPADGPTRVVTPHGLLLERLAGTVHAAAGGSAFPRDLVGLYVALGMVDSDPEALRPALAASREGTGPFDLTRFFQGGFRAIHPLWPLAMLNNVAVGQLAADLDVEGDHVVLAAEADAGARALGSGADAVREGTTRLALVAGIGETLAPAALLRARLRGRAGFVLGEGGAALALGTPTEAVPALGHVSGEAFTFERSPDGAGPSANAFERAAREALARAGARPEEIGVLFVEGDGVEEAQARRALFGRRTDLAVVAPAMALGHLLAGAPVLAVALATRILAAGRAPSTALGRPRTVPHGTRALVLAGGSGGGAGALVVEGPA
jgi:3-oxoacyl-(acyl-carrier-protein) synthase